MQKKQAKSVNQIMEELKESDYESYQDIETEVIKRGQRINQQEKSFKSTD